MEGRESLDKIIESVLAWQAERDVQALIDEEEVASLQAGNPKK